MRFRFLPDTKLQPEGFVRYVGQRGCGLPLAGPNNRNFHTDSLQLLAPDLLISNAQFLYSLHLALGDLPRDDLRLASIWHER
jgi:hypothetical protein